MGFNEDYYWTGGDFKDWSGDSAGKFFSSGGGSKGGASGGGSNQPGPNDWKDGCGCLIVIILCIAGWFIYSAWKSHREEEQWRREMEDYKAYTDSVQLDDSFEQSQYALTEDSVAEEANDYGEQTSRSTGTQSKPFTTTRSPHRTYSSHSYSDDDEYDEDGMYKDEDEDIKDKRQYDDDDDDEADDWE